MRPTCLGIEAMHQTAEIGHEEQIVFDSGAADTAVHLLLKSGVVVLLLAYVTVVPNEG